MTVPVAKPQRFDPKISMGNVLTIVSIFIAAASTWATTQAGVARIEERLEAEVKARITTDQRHDDELARLRTDIRSDLKEIHTEIKDVRASIEALRDGIPRRR
jgi:hypothetical protein